MLSLEQGISENRRLSCLLCRRLQGTEGPPQSPHPDERETRFTPSPLLGEGRIVSAPGSEVQARARWGLRPRKSPCGELSP